MGKVYLVGVGPGSVDLLTVRALRLVQSADVILYDALVGTEILECASAEARLINVGKRGGRKSYAQEDINALMVYSAQTAEKVVRLKGGDPAVFGRAAEEIAALRAAGIEYEIVPGVTAACSAAAAIGISLTDRHVSSGISFLTAHSAEENESRNWLESSITSNTLVIYMPGRDYQRISTDLISAGVAGATPCVVVSKISSAEQRAVKTTVAELGQISALPAPAVLVVGEVVGVADLEDFVAEYGQTVNEVRRDVAYVSS